MLIITLKSRILQVSLLLKLRLVLPLNLYYLLIRHLLQSDFVRSLLKCRRLYFRSVDFNLSFLGLLPFRKEYQAN